MIKAWKSHARIHGHKERVEILAPVFLIVIPRDRRTCRCNTRVELKFNTVVAAVEDCAWKLEVSIEHECRCCDAVDPKVAYVSVAKVQRKVKLDG